MIILDTNVISETQKKAPDDAVMDWLDAQAPDVVHIHNVMQAQVISAIAVKRCCSGSSHAADGR